MSVTVLLAHQLKLQKLDLMWHYWGEKRICGSRRSKTFPPDLSFGYVAILRTI